MTTDPMTHTLQGTTLDPTGPLGRHDVAHFRTADDVAREVLALYGDPLETAAGVVHVTSVWRAADGSLVTLRIDQHAPPSRHDFFVLNLCRARSDAIVVSGKILRDEPTVRHELQGPGELPRALAAWRRQRLGKHRPPISLVLSSGRDLDLDHPLFESATQPQIYTTPAAVDTLAMAAAERGITLIADPRADLRRAIDHLRRQGAATISIECGPHTSASLYQPPLAVDELLLSVYQGELAPRSRGTVLMRHDQLTEHMVAARPPVCRLSESGPWCFERYLARRPDRTTVPTEPAIDGDPS